MAWIDKIDLASITAVEIHYITLDKIAPLLSKLKKFTMLESLTFCDNNITSLRQLNILSTMKIPRKLALSITHNPVVTHSLFIDYVVSILASINCINSSGAGLIRSLNGVEVSEGVVLGAGKKFKTLHNLTSNSPLKAITPPHSSSQQPPPTNAAAAAAAQNYTKSSSKPATTACDFVKSALMGTVEERGRRAWFNRVFDEMVKGRISSGGCGGGF